MSSRSIRLSSTNKPVRRRATEALSPRVQDLCAERLRALAVCAREVGAVALEDGTRVDAPTLDALAEEQRVDEREMIAKWKEFEDGYARYAERAAPRRALVSTAIEALAPAAAHHGKLAKAALRTAKLNAPSRKMLDLLERKSG